MNYILENRFKKGIILFMLTVFAVAAVYHPVQAKLVPINRIGEAERIIYGEIKQDQDIQQRIQNLELTLFNHTTKGTLINRAEGILEYVFMKKGQSSLVFLMNAMEWSLQERIKTGAILDRVQQMEKTIFDEVTKNKGLEKRINRLSKAILSDEEPPFAEVKVPAGTSIQVELLDKISSSQAEVGDKYKFKILENIEVKDSLIIPENIRGTLRVSKVEASGPLGKDARIQLEVMDIITIDGSSIPVQFNLKNNEDESNSRGLAVGASLLSAVILGHPLGLIAGYFVSGEEQVIPAHSRFELKTRADRTVNGIKFE